jgi:hypothetical protein
MDWKKLALEQAILLEQQRQRIAELESKIAALEKNSSNSSKPLSSDIVKPPKPKDKERRKRKIGAQKGHQQNLRQPLAPELVGEIIKLELTTCPDCGHKLDLEQRHLHLDETSFKKNGKLQWAWCFVSEFFTFFKIDASRGSKETADCRRQTSADFNSIASSLASAANCRLPSFLLGALDSRD